MVCGTDFLSMPVWSSGRPSRSLTRRVKTGITAIHTLISEPCMESWAGACPVSAPSRCLMAVRSALSLRAIRASSCTTLTIARSFCSYPVIHGPANLAGDGPHEGRRFPCDSDHDLIGIFAPSDQPPVALTESHLGLPTNILKGFGDFFQPELQV